MLTALARFSFSRKSASQSLTDANDEALVKAFSQGDYQGFEILYARHKQAVFRYFLRQSLSGKLINSAIAEELCQDCWLSVVNHIEGFNHESSFLTWLFSIARNRWIDFSRKKSNHEQALADDKLGVLTGLEFDSHDVDGDAKVESSAEVHQHVSSLALSIDGVDAIAKHQAEARFKEDFLQALVDLPEPQREVFVLKQEGEFTLDEVALICGRPKEQVKSQWRYSVEKLSHALKDYAELAKEGM